VGKTFGAEELGKHFGVETFYTQFRADTKREEVFGPLSMTKLQQDVYEHVTQGYLPEAVDRRARRVRGRRPLHAPAPQRAQRAWFVNGGVRTTIPLVTAIGTTNVWLDAEELAALMDRFAQRIVVEPVKTSNGFKKILKGQLERDAGTKRAKKLTVIGADELRVLRAGSQDVQASTRTSSTWSTTCARARRARTSRCRRAAGARASSWRRRTRSSTAVTS
jgi:MoxR-like ATPase